MPFCKNDELTFFINEISFLGYIYHKKYKHESKYATA